MIGFIDQDCGVCGVERPCNEGICIICSKDGDKAKLWFTFCELEQAARKVAIKSFGVPMVTRLGTIEAIKNLADLPD